ncbi:methyltransferase family protein [Propionicimonas paludicola]|uniref:Methyltransferase family protein n=1 Tax=Propionicimonas paludicola TaxID=185243 RepID=A0A2A9CVR9_9ACTN|nr:methyltransferase [Propionicimonas paludicola]PFG17752.1 methyltransferase family protein [Propionicimonas paludicola]
MLDETAIDALRRALVAADYTLDAVSERLGNVGLAGLARNASVPALRTLAGATDSQAELIRFWLLGLPMPAGTIRPLLGCPDMLVEAGLIAVNGDEWRAAIELKPHGSQARSGWICSDQTPLDGRVVPPSEDFVLGASPASTTLAQLVPPGHYGRVLDLGTGCGIQGLHLDAEQLVATDLNPRALELACISLRLSGLHADLRLGSLYEPVAGEQFDLIVTNPPYVIGPPRADRLIYRDGGLAGDDLMREVVTGAAEHLNPGGYLVVLGNWAITDRPWDERLTEWITPTGCDALVLQREVLDAFEYIELWLADAGLTGRAEYLPRYRQWLDYFADNGITSVGLGWLVLRRADRDQPEVRFEDWPHAVHQPVGTAFANFFTAVDAARLPEPEFWAQAWKQAPGLTQETFGRPGAADPEHLVLRQGYGFGRAMEPGTALAAVVGACDGELPLGALVAAVAGLLDEDGQTLANELLPTLRELVSLGYLVGEDSQVLTGFGQSGH